MLFYVKRVTKTLVSDDEVFWEVFSRIILQLVYHRVV